MDTSAIIFSSAIFAAVLSLIVFINQVAGQPKSVIGRLTRITEGKHIPTIEELELAKPFFERVVGPIARNMLDAIIKHTPQNVKDGIRKRLIMSGNPRNLHSEEFLAIKALTTVAIPIGVMLMCRLIGIPANQTMFFTMVFAFLGFMLPDSYINQAIKIRQKDIQNSLPYFMDLLVVAVEAGLGFDAAVTRVISKNKGPLTDEFNRALQEMRIGKMRREALRDISNRTGLEDLSSFLAAIIQADELGISIGNVLRVQAQQLRVKRRQRAEEKAMQLPVKMLFPLIFCIFPAIFVVLLGPAGITIMTTLPELTSK